MINRIISLALAAALLAGCSSQASGLQQVRENKEEHVPMLERYPYKEIEAYLAEEKPEELISLIEMLPFPETKAQVISGNGQKFADHYLGYLEEMKTLSDNKALHDFVADAEPYFKKAAESADEEVQYDNLKEGQRLIDYLHQTTDKLN